MGVAIGEKAAVPKIGQRFSVARNMLNMKMPIDDIIGATGLTREQIQSLTT